MAGTVNLNFKIINSAGATIPSGIPVYLLNQIYSNPFTSISTSIYTSGTTDAAGTVLFSGIAANTYDVQINASGGNSIIRNYIVKNEFPVAIGESNMGFGNSNYIGSNEPGINILTQDKTTNARSIRVDLTSVTGNSVNKVTGTLSYTVYPFTGTEIYNTTVVYSKQSGNSYYHNTDAIPFTQRARFTVS